MSMLVDENAGTVEAGELGEETRTGGGGGDDEDEDERTRETERPRET